MMQFIGTRLLLTFTACAALSSAVTLTDNLSKTSTDTEFVGGDTWIAVAFSTDNANYQISSASLLLSTPEPSTANLDLYSESSGQPGLLLSTLTSLGSFPSVASPVTFTGSSYILSPNSTYWLVLSAPTGSFDWSWTSDNAGAGAGFLSQWAATDDAGGSWITSDIEPMQFRVLADPGTPAVPEPGSFTLAALSMAGVATALRMRKNSMQ
jgi:hypothetical protein